MQLLKSINVKTTGQIQQEGREMTIQPFMSRMFFLIVASVTASCSWIPTYIPDSGVEIELEPTPNGRVASASFWSDDEYVVLRGEIVPRPVPKSPLSGHVPAVTNQPDWITSDCFTMRHRMAARHIRKPYSFHFQQIPPPGSVVRVFYHEHSRDHVCVGAQSAGEVS